MANAQVDFASIKAHGTRHAEDQRRKGIDSVGSIPVALRPTSAIGRCRPAEFPG